MARRGPSPRPLGRQVRRRGAAEGAGRLASPPVCMPRTHAGFPALGAPGGTGGPGSQTEKRAQGSGTAARTHTAQSRAGQVRVPDRPRLPPTLLLDPPPPPQPRPAPRQPHTQTLLPDRIPTFWVRPLVWPSTCPLSPGPTAGGTWCSAHTSGLVLPHRTHGRQPRHPPRWPTGAPSPAKTLFFCAVASALSIPPHAVRQTPLHPSEPPL